MSRLTTYISKNRRDLISIFTTLFVGLLVIGAINQTSVNSQRAAENARLLKLQNQAITQQSQILFELQKSTKTLKADNAINLQIIICMLQVPQPQRTTDLANQCRKQVTVTDNGSVASPPVSSSSADGTSNQQGAATTQPSATANATATAPPAQPTPVDTCNTRLLGLCLIP